MTRFVLRSLPRFHDEPQLVHRCLASLAIRLTVPRFLAAGLVVVRLRTPSSFTPVLISAQHERLLPFSVFVVFIFCVDLSLPPFSSEPTFCVLRFYSIFPITRVRCIVRTVGRLSTALKWCKHSPKNIDKVLRFITLLQNLASFPSRIMIVSISSQEKRRNVYAESEFDNWSVEMDK